MGSTNVEEYFFKSQESLASVIDQNEDDDDGDDDGGKLEVVETKDESKTLKRMSSV